MMTTEKIDAIAQALAYLMERELSCILLSLDGYKRSSAPGLEEVVTKKEGGAERVRGILDGLGR